MNIEQQKTLCTLANPRWEAQMYLDLWDALATPRDRLTLHNQAVAALNALIQQAHAEKNPGREALYCGCLALLRTGYDL